MNINDKMLHLFGCITISMIITFISLIFISNLWLALFIGGGITFVSVTVYKEIWNDLIKKRGKFELMDILANLIGSIIGSSFIVILIPFILCQ
jgi:hypothetical protein